MNVLDEAEHVVKEMPPEPGQDAALKVGHLQERAVEEVETANSPDLAGGYGRFLNKRDGEGDERDAEFERY